VLCVPWAREAALRPLVEAFRRAPNSPHEPKQALATAIEALADLAVESDLIELSGMASHGTSRGMLVLALGKLDSTAVDDTLIDRLRDRTVGGHAVAALQRIAERRRIEVDLAHLKPFFNDPRPWVRRAVRDLAHALERQR
jgi:HEAT repeat protein